MQTLTIPFFHKAKRLISKMTSLSPRSQQRTSANSRSLVSEAGRYWKNTVVLKEQVEKEESNVRQLTSKIKDLEVGSFCM